MQAVVRGYHARQSDSDPGICLGYVGRQPSLDSKSTANTGGARMLRSVDQCKGQAFETTMTLSFKGGAFQGERATGSRPGKELYAGSIDPAG